MKYIILFSIFLMEEGASATVNAVIAP